jgi:hypothetical protein
MNNVTSNEVLKYMRETIGWVRSSRKDADCISQNINSHRSTSVRSISYLLSDGTYINYSDILDWVTKKRYNQFLNKIIEQ